MVGGAGGTVNSRKMMGGVFKKIAAKSATGNNNGYEFTVRDTAVRVHIFCTGNRMRLLFS